MAETNAADFYLVEGDTFWHDLGVDRVACSILEGPREMIRGYSGKQWLVRVSPPVRDKGVETDLVLVDSHPPNIKATDFWAVLNTGTYSLPPDAVQDEDQRFDIKSTLGGHKMSAVTDPDRLLRGKY